MEVIVLNNQSQFDIAIQEHGTVEAVFDVAKGNDVSITDYLVPGYKLLVDKSEAVDQPIQNYYAKNALLPATSNPEIEGQSEIKQGIGYWNVGSTFKVS